MDSHYESDSDVTHGAADKHCAVCLFYFIYFARKPIFQRCDILMHFTYLERFAVIFHESFEKLRWPDALQLRA